MQLNSATR